MLRDESEDIPPPQKLPKELDKWRSPVGGFPGRNPNLFLAVEAWLPRDTPLVAAPSLLRLFEMLVARLGDHRVTIDSWLKYKQLYRTGLGWRFQQYTASLHCLVSWLATAEAWRALEPIGSHLFMIEAFRGRGQARQLVWALEWHTGCSPFSLRVRTSHFTKGEATEVNELVSQFLRAAADIGALYGRAGLVQRPDETRYSSPEPNFEPTQKLHWWERALETGRPVVPGVFRANLLDGARLKQLGGLDALKPLRVGSEGLQVESHGTHALIWASRLASWHFEQPYGVWGEDHIPFAGEALLHLFAKGGMLTVQNMDWVEQDIHEWRTHADPKTRPKAPKIKQTRARPQDWLARLQSRPPRWLAPCATAPRTALPAKLAEQFGPEYVHFAVEPPPGKPALTLYGAPTGDPVFVGSPVLIGSPTRERALAVFDQMDDGYDAQVLGDDRPPLAARPKRRLRQFKCPSCDGRFFTLRIVLEYTDLDELEDNEKARAEEFFSWIWIVATCTGCAWAGVAVDVECA